MTDHTIKAIETQFKGYRFRSRLEARWAVFFDALGIQWEYEKEGYDLGELGWYLPDFWLPEFNQWVEVKPPTTETAKSVYLAGNFHSDWRYEFVRGDYRERSMDDASIVKSTNFGRTYTGPFWVDLADGHRGGGHIVFDFGEGENAKHRQIVHDRCLSQIEKSDIVFAWINKMDCYGTLAEIGYAKAKGKTIWIGIDEKLEKPDDDHYYTDSDQLWFVKKMADVVAVGSNAFNAYMGIDPLTLEQSKVDALVIGSSEREGFFVNGAIVYGDPMDKKVDMFLNQGYRGGNRFHKFGNLFVHKKLGLMSLPEGWGLNNGEIDFSQAAQKARSARF